MCQQSMLDMLSSEDEDDIISSHEDDEHSAWTLFLDVVGAKSLGHAGGKFPCRLGACEDSSELSFFSGSLVAGDVRCLVV